MEKINWDKKPVKLGEEFDFDCYNCFNSLFKNSINDSFGGNCNKYFDMNRFSSIPAVAYFTISEDASVQSKMPIGALSSFLISCSR